MHLLGKRIDLGIARNTYACTDSPSIHLSQKKYILFRKSHKLINIKWRLVLVLSHVIDSLY